MPGRAAAYVLRRQPLPPPLDVGKYLSDADIAAKSQEALEKPWSDQLIAVVVNRDVSRRREAAAATEVRYRHGHHGYHDFYRSLLLLLLLLLCGGGLFPPPPARAGRRWPCIAGW